MENASSSPSGTGSAGQEAKMESDGMRELLAGQGFAEHVSIAASEKLQYVGSLGVLVDAAAGSKWMYEGHIVDYDEEPRTRSKANIISSRQKRKATSPSDERVAMDLMYLGMVYI